MRRAIRPAVIVRMLAARAAPTRLSCGAPRIAPSARDDSTEALVQADSTDPSDPADPTEKAEANEPIDPIDRAEPTEQIERTEPLEPTDRREFSDRTESVPICGD